MTAARRLPGGLYLVVDPADGLEHVLPRIEAALVGGVDVLQIWDHWAPSQDAAAFVEATLAASRPRGVPVLVHGNLELLAGSGADGIHYDTPSSTPAEVRERAGRDVIYGVTCGNDLERVQWAERERADYVSFCSMFPSPSVGACELVSLETVTAARALTRVTLFASGGITPGNAGAVVAAGADGIAVVSGILGAEDPADAARAYARALRSAGSPPAGRHA